jgi:hypothetical protein
VDALRIITIIVKEHEIGRACSTSVEKENAYRILVGRPEGKRSLRRPSRRVWILVI